MLRAMGTTRPQRPARGLPGPVIGLAFLLVTLILLGYVYSRIEPRGDDAPGAGAAAEGVDPFAGVPPDVPPEPRGGAKAEPAADPFAGVTDLTGTPLWTRAAALADEGYELMARAADEREAGRRAEAEELSAQARAKLEEALRSTDDYERERTEQHGDGNADVREITRLRQRWRREVAGIRKAEGG